MNETNNTIPSQVGTSKLVRAKFGPGMLLQHEDLELLNTYTRDLSRLMFRSFFGCGVICGLVVVADSKCDTIKVGTGVALSCSGDPIWVTKVETFKMNESCDSNPRKDYWVKLCGKVSNCGPRTAVCSSDEDESTSEWTRERLGYEISLVESREAGCGCGCPDPGPDTNKVKEERIGLVTTCRCVNPSLPTDPKYRCYEKHYAGECECSCDDCGGCACDCVWLAKVKWLKKDSKWLVDHRPRRFVRPVLMRDPEVEKEEILRNKPTDPTAPPVPDTQFTQVVSDAINDVFKDIAEDTVGTRLRENKDLVALLREAAKKELEKIEPGVAMTVEARDIATEAERAELLESIREEAINEVLKAAANREAAMRAELEELHEKVKALEATRPAAAEVSDFDTTAPVEAARPEPTATKTETKKRTTTKKPGGGTQ